MSDFTPEQREPESAPTPPNFTELSISRDFEVAIAAVQLTLSETAEDETRIRMKGLLRILLRLEEKLKTQRKG